MRKTRMIVAICFLLIVTPMLRALGLSMTVTPNPGAVKGSIKGDGTYDVDNKQTFVRVNFTTTNSGTKAMPSGNDATGGGTWTVTFTVPAGTYNPSEATLYYMEGTNLKTVIVQNTVNKVVN